MEDAAAEAAPANNTVLRVAAISGSLRRASANTGLIRAGKAPHPCLGYYYLFSYLTADC
jgi:hypothetical protein